MSIRGCISTHVLYDHQQQCLVRYNVAQPTRNQRITRCTQMVMFDSHLPFSAARSEHFYIDLFLCRRYIQPRFCRASRPTSSFSRPAQCCFPIHFTILTSDKKNQTIHDVHVTPLLITMLARIRQVFHSSVHDYSSKQKSRNAVPWVI